MSRHIIPLALPLALLTAGVSLDAAGGQARRFAEVEPVAVRTTAAPLQGRLEIVWGDAAPGSSAKHRHTVSLVDDAGRRTFLDPAAALKAAGDLHALYGRRVAITLAPQVRTKSASALARPEAIVPIDDLSSGAKVSGGGFSTKAVTGTTVWATIMCKFKDIATEQKPKSFFQGQYGTAAGQLDHYWREVSYGKINLTGSAAYGWFTLPQNRSYYVTASGADLTKLFNDCTAVANASVNFAANGGLQGINMMFNGDLDGYAWGGSRCATLDGINKCWSTTWNPPWSFNNLAPLSHEMGHAYGLPHANNSDNDSDTYDNPWDVMSDAWNNANTSTTYGTLPKHINMYSRDRLGWVNAARKRTIPWSSTLVRFELEAASVVGSTKTQMVVLPVPGSTTRWYVIEARALTGTYESRLAGKAVIVHSVDTSRASPSWSMDASSPPATVSNNEGSMFKVGEIWTSPEPAGRKFRVQVNNSTATGFTIDVTGI